METIDPDALLLVGSIWRAHGVKGELKVLPETDDPHRLLELDTLYLGSDPTQVEPRQVESIRTHRMKRGLVLIVKLADIDDREWAETFRRVSVFAREDDLPPLADDEVFVHDLVGLDVEDESGARIGTVKDVLPAPAQDMYVIEREEGEDAMVPAVEKFVSEVDLEAGRLVIRPIEGLLD